MQVLCITMEMVEASRHSNRREEPCTQQTPEPTPSQAPNQEDKSGGFTPVRRKYCNRTKKNDGQDEESIFIPMSSESYAGAVSKLREIPYRTVGQGTLDDPFIYWLCEAKDIPQGRVEGVERVCRLACRQKRQRMVWIRCGPHSTKRTLTIVDGEVEKKIEPDDLHITASLGNSYEYEYDAHLYCACSHTQGVTDRLATEEERKYKQDVEGFPICLLDRKPQRAQARKRNPLSHT
ncbi:hypothetical protein BJX70DRAFT_402851 [Aspergillus crustosus]